MSAAFLPCSFALEMTGLKMQSHLNYIQDRLSQLHEPGACVLILGSPTIQFMNSALREFPRFVFSVHEVHETCLQELKRFGAHPNVTVNENLVTAEGGLVACYQYNQRGFNGLSPFKVNQSILPNIRSLGSQLFSSEPFGAACKAAGVHERGHHILVFGLQASASVVCTPSQFNDLRKFRFVLLQAPPSGLYEDEHGKQNTVELLKRAGFSVSLQTTAPVYPFEDILFERDDAFLLEVELVSTKAALLQEQALTADLRVLLDASAAGLKDTQTALKAAEDGLSSLAYENKFLRTLTKELSEKITKTEGQLTMIRELFLADRDALRAQDQ